MTAILYQDPQVTIYQELIVINKYYFPLATSRNILPSEIERVTVYDSKEVTHRWGLCTKYLNNWFPLDTNRKNKSKFIEIIVRGKKMRPSITPDDPDRVAQVIWENFTNEGREYTAKKSESEGRQSEIAQQELIEREKGEQEVSEQQLTGAIIRQEEHSKEEK